MDLIVEGIFDANERGFGFVSVIDEEMEDIFIPPASVNNAFNGDKVEVRITSKGSDGRSAEGIITKILERNTKVVIGRFEKNKSYGFVVSNNRKITQDVFIPKADFKGAKDNDIVLAEITKWPSKGRSAEGKITKILGKQGDPGVDVLSIMYDYNLSDTFPKAVIKEAKAIPMTLDKEELKKRVDLRDLTIVTIDGEDAKDLDDAISIEKLENGNFELGVHIADVSYYVKEGSELDQEAYKRGTSTYLVDRVIPMLPKELSNGICSLNAHEDRFAFTVMMTIDKTGKIIDSEMFKSVINVNERMSYNNVTAILEGSKDKELKKYDYLKKDFKLMEELSGILRNRRHKRGSIDFDIPECKIILDEKGHIKDIVKYELTVSNNIIEDFMLAANETVAEKFYWLEAPFVYRVHEAPDSEKMEDFIRLISTYGYKVKGLSKLKAKAFQEVLEKIKGAPEEKVISTLMLRSMQQARYNPENMGHFGLAAEYYCHFTSPIRRYPDLFIHRVMSEMIENGYRFKNDRRLKKLKRLANEAAIMSSDMERNAQNAERDSKDVKKVEYMTQFVGEEFDGVISSVTSFGFFVELPNTIEGLVRVESIQDDYYVYNEKTYSLIGEHTKKMYKIGDQVRVKLVRADMEIKKIDFEVV